jgi:hypothetical protein
MLDHISITVAAIAAAERFYNAIMSVPSAPVLRHASNGTLAFASASAISMGKIKMKEAAN